MKKLICVFASIFLIISLFAACDINALVKLEHEEDAKLMLNYLEDLINAIKNYVNSKDKDLNLLNEHLQIL